MNAVQPDLFAQDDAKRNAVSDVQREAIRARLKATLARLEAAEAFFWRDPLDAVHEENRFEREAGMLGEEGAALWARFDREMERLHATQFASEAEGAPPVR